MYVTMTWFGVVANGTALTFPCSNNVNPGLGNKNQWFAVCNWSARSLTNFRSEWICSARRPARSAAFR